MRTFLLFIFVSCLFVSCKSIDKNPIETTYYFIRHAEKDRTDKTNRDPELTNAGHERARHWAKYFEAIDLDVVYSTNYKRTTSTAVQTAINKGLEVQLYNPRTLNDSLFQAATKGKTVLVVGHSNTTPAFVNAVLGEEKYPAIDDTNNGNLYTLTITRSGEMESTLERIERD